jgi:hypothetical protein
MIEGRKVGKKDKKKTKKKIRRNREKQRRGKVRWEKKKGSFEELCEEPFENNLLMAAASKFLHS